MELECKRQDGSWHPCRISLSEDNAAIIVAYEVSSEEEEEELERIVSREEGLARLRFRSKFLWGGECAKVMEGQRVLASHGDSSANLFFDAVVEKVNRVRHSDRLACRCTFSVKWLTNHTQDQKLRVTSACIMRLSDKSIETHPVVEAFKEPANSSAENGAMAFSENLFDVDLNATLENQMENVVMDQGAECSKDGIVRLRKVNKKSSEPPNSDIRVTMYNSKQEIETPLEEAIKRASSNSFLSPLAARAALASVLCTLPVSALSKHLGEFPVSPELTSKGDVGFPFFSPISANVNPPKQAMKYPLAPNQLDCYVYNSSSERTVGVNLGSEKIDPVTPRRITRSSGEHGLPKQTKEQTLKPNQLNYNSESERTTVSFNPMSEKFDYIIPRRITRSAVKRDGEDMMIGMQENEKLRGIEKKNKKSGNGNFTPDVEDNIATPVMSEKKKRICISPVASSATSASIVTNSISDCEGETCQDAESRAVAKRAKTVFRKPPTRFSVRLAQLDNNIS